MRKGITIILLFISMLAYAQQEVIDKADKLLEEKKYKSAFLLLEESDPENKIPSIAIAKTNLLLDYFISTVMHQVFGLKDLEPGQDLQELRGKKGEYDMFLFAPDTVLSKLINQYPDNFALHKTLGKYYHEVHLKFGRDWIVSDSAVVLNFMKNYGRAYEKGVYDARSLYGLGYGFLLFKNYEQSIPFFKQSIEIDSTDPAAHYNLGYAYLFNDEREKAIVSATTAIKLYNFPPYAAEAARLAAVAYAEMNNVEKSLMLYRHANQINPNDYNTLRPLLAMEVQLADTGWMKTAANLHALAPANPTIYQDLMHIFWKNGKEDFLIEFLEQCKPVFNSDTAVSANLFFFIGKVQFDKGDTSLAITNFKYSRELFEQVYKPEHAVFTVIDDYIRIRE